MHVQGCIPGCWLHVLSMVDMNCMTGVMPCGKLVLHKLSSSLQHDTSALASIACVVCIMTGLLQRTPQLCADSSHLKRFFAVTCRTSFMHVWSISGANNCSVIKCHRNEIHAMPLWNAKTQCYEQASQSLHYPLRSAVTPAGLKLFICSHPPNV